MTKIVIESIEAAVWAHGGDELPTPILLTMEIDLDNLDDVARRAYHSRMGSTSFGAGAIRAFVQDEGEEG